jgi:hypothetical protein
VSGRLRPLGWLVARLLLLGLVVLPQAGQAGLADEAAILAQNSGLDRDGREFDPDEDDDDDEDDEDEDTASLSAPAGQKAAISC